MRTATPPATAPAAVRDDTARDRGTVSRRPPGRRWSRRLFGTLAPLTAATVVLGLLVRWTVRDGWSPAAPLFYALSVPVLAVLTVAAVFLWLLRCGLRVTWKRCLALFGLGVVILLNVAVLGWPDATVDPIRPRILLWNVASGGLPVGGGIDGTFDVIAGYNADVVVLIEAPPHHDGGEATYRAAFPDHFVTRPGWGITVLTRGQREGGAFVTLGPGAHAAVVKTRPAGRADRGDRGRPAVRPARRPLRTAGEARRTGGGPVRGAAHADRRRLQHPRRFGLVRPAAEDVPPRI